MERYYKVGELAKLYGVSPDLLRYYEKKGLLHPKRLENGYRAYSVREVWRLNVIRDLRALDLPVEVIARYLEDHSAATTRTLLEDELALLDEQIARLQTLRAGVSRRLKAADRAYARPQGVCELQTLPPRRCHSLAAPYRTDAEMDPLLQELRRFDPSTSMSGATTGSAVISRWLRPAKGAARTTPAFSCCTRPARRRCPAETG